jgi:hypothetical protein
LTTGALAGLGFPALGTRVDLAPADTIFVGSAGAWGAWYGAMVPLALDLDGSMSTLLLSSSLTGDAFLILGGVLLSPRVGLEAESALLAELGGLGGATLGALGASLASADGTRVAQGAVIGSTVGLLAGAVVTATRGVSAPVLPVPRLRLPTGWSISPTALVGPDEELAWGLKLSGR